jgi:hypothetical protein
MPPESNVESTLIWYRANDEQNYKYWTEELDKFLEGEQYYLYCRVHFTACTRAKVGSLLSHWADFTKSSLARQIIERIPIPNFMKI